MQQDLEDKKNEIIIEGLENKIKDYEASLEKKDFLLHATEGSLAEIQAENVRLSEELLQSQTALKDKSKNFIKRRKICKRNTRPKLTRIRSCRNLWKTFEIHA
jgi:ribosomal protein L24